MPEEAAADVGDGVLHSVLNLGEHRSWESTATLGSIGLHREAELEARGGKHWLLAEGFPQVLEGLLCDRGPLHLVGLGLPGQIVQGRCSGGKALDELPVIAHQPQKRSHLFLGGGL